MTDHHRPSPLGRINPVKHWGPLVLVVALLIAVCAVASVKGGTTTTKTTAAPTQNKAKTWAKNPQLPVTYADAKKSGTVDQYDWGKRCDTKTGRIKVPSVYAPPCVPVWHGTKPWKNRGGQKVTSNGGATAPGVDDKTITVVYYVESPQDLASLAQQLGVLDSFDTMQREFQRLVDASNHLYELYGRKVVLKKFQGTGNGVDPVAARADAIKVANEMHAFASIGGPSQTPAYADELASRHVMCISCSYAVPDSSFQKDAPYQWGTLPTPEQLVYSVFDYGIAHLWNRPARFAGDPKMRKEKRVFGVVHYEQDPPVFKSLEKQVLRHYASTGHNARLTLTYLLNPNTLNEQAQTIIGKLKAAHVTSVVFLGDPLMPLYLTQQAAKQDYHPEWIITGTVFTDSTAAGRLYDPGEWKHAFGTSFLPARTRPQLSEPWQFYKWYFGKDPEATKTIQVLVPEVQLLFIGLQGAGPHLNAETYAGGMFNYPPSGGGVANPRISFGFHGLFPKADYVAVDDFTTVWWDATAKGPDEQGKQGTGMWAYVDGGKRYLLGHIPKGDDSKLFNLKGAVTLYNTPPKDQPPPHYPPWPGSPAAGG